MAEIADNLRKIADASTRSDGSDIPLGQQLRKAADALDAKDKRIAELEAALKFTDAQAAQVEALIDPHIQWECATDGCGKPATVHFERGGVGSYYCLPCYTRIQALRPSLPSSISNG